MKEKDAQNWFMHNNTRYGVFELKLSKNPSIRFDSLKEHQIKALTDISGERGLYYKINDAPYTMKFTQKKPFDCFHLKNIPAYVVICWYKPRTLKEFHYIEIKNFLKEVEIATRKSLTFQRSCEIASYKLKL